MKKRVEIAKKAAIRRDIKRVHKFRERNEGNKEVGWDYNWQNESWEWQAQSNGNGNGEEFPAPVGIGGGPLPFPAAGESSQSQSSLHETTEMPPDPQRLRYEATNMAQEIKGIADSNRNSQLSFTEVTEFLNDTEHAGFARWVKQRKQAGFRDFDHDRQGSFDLNELTQACESFLEESAMSRPPSSVMQRTGPGHESLRPGSVMSMRESVVRGGGGEGMDRLGPDLTDTGGMRREALSASLSLPRADRNRTPWGELGGEYGEYHRPRPVYKAGKKYSFQGAPRNLTPHASTPVSRALWETVDKPQSSLTRKRVH